MRIFGSAIISMACVCMTGLASVAAQEAQGMSADQNGVDSGDWDIQAGAIAIAGNDYPGADAIQGMVVPYFDVSWRDRYFIDPIRGIGVQWGGGRDVPYSLQAGIAWDFGRDEDDSAALRGLGDLDGGPALRIAGDYRLGYISLGATLMQSLGGDTGTELVLNAGTRLPAGERLTIIPSVRATIGNDERHDAFFGVMPDQAAASIYTPYDPDGGVTSYGVQLVGFYDITDRLFATGIIASDTLTGDAADSPIVEREDQLFIALGLVRKF
ncbi:MipA/OmpV family protein [Parvularcula flava]|uniref:MipA/OmpV family protein n=1 Tax=Aquisalinus luteolus TaxID=1566827 RepID=A0A8J3A4B6_9PROT|nr:MipA/OmpV family protein [Aquisalinus luteolus]NHK26683.1 MipA/OmpV family protein [Aquisalinus luteolus]GGH93087.1 MltA-interacting MipA family protein [Aquisalinus luteolus]